MHNITNEHHCKCLRNSISLIWLWSYIWIFLMCKCSSWLGAFVSKLFKEQRCFSAKKMVALQPGTFIVLPRHSATTAFQPNSDFSPTSATQPFAHAWLTLPAFNKTRPLDTHWSIVIFAPITNNLRLAKVFHQCFPCGTALGQYLLIAGMGPFHLYSYAYSDCPILYSCASKWNSPSKDGTSP